MTIQDYKNAAVVLKSFVTDVSRQIDRQQVADENIRATMSKYMLNDRNSVSGENFKSLIVDLHTIHNEWLKHVNVYLDGIGQTLTN